MERKGILLILKLIINFILIILISNCSFEMGKAPKEKIFNTSERASYLIKRSKSLRYMGKIEPSIKLMENASLNFMASGNKEKFFLTNIQILILSLTHGKKRDYEAELSKLINFNLINKLKMDGPILVVKVYLNYKNKKNEMAINLINDHLLSLKDDELKSKIYFLSLKLEVLNHVENGGIISSLSSYYERYKKKFTESRDSDKKINLELLSKASFNLGLAYLKKRNLKKSNFWFFKNYKINKELQHYFKLIPTLDYLKTNSDKMGLKKKSEYYQTLKQNYSEFINSL